MHRAHPKHHFSWNSPEVQLCTLCHYFRWLPVPCTDSRPHNQTALGWTDSEAPPPKQLSAECNDFTFVYAVFGEGENLPPLHPSQVCQHVFLQVTGKITYTFVGTNSCYHQDFRWTYTLVAAMYLVIWLWTCALMQMFIDISDNNLGSNDNVAVRCTTVPV